MPIDIHTQAYKEALASAPANQDIVGTVEFQVPRADGTDAIVRMSNDRGTLVSPETETEEAVWGHHLRLEEDAPNNPGEVVFFGYCPFAIEWPEITDAPQPTCSISIANVARQLAPYMDGMVESGRPLKLVCRDYLLSDTDTPTAILRNLFIRSVKSDVARVTGSAEFWDPVNQNFGLLYLAKYHRSLTA